MMFLWIILISIINTHPLHLTEALHNHSSPQTLKDNFCLNVYAREAVVYKHYPCNLRKLEILSDENIELETTQSVNNTVHSSPVCSVCVCERAYMCMCVCVLELAPN